MKRDYFNRLEFKQALLISRVDPLEAKQRFLEYIKKYPQDYTTYTYLATLLITLRDIEGAQKVLDTVEELVKNDTNFCNNVELIDKYRENYNFTKIKLLFYQNKYDEILNTYIRPEYNGLTNADLIQLRNNFVLGSLGLKGVKYYCLKKQGKLTVPREVATSYLFRQIIDYQENDFWDHMKKHLLGDDNGILSDSLFAFDFPIYDVVNEIKKTLPNEKGLYNGFLENIYTFKYNECGRVQNRVVDYFQVVAFHETTDFITMYPLLNGEYLPYVDLNYMHPVSENVKVKRKSQIDKFNQRFGNK